MARRAKTPTNGCRATQWRPGNRRRASGIASRQTRTSGSISMEKRSRIRSTCSASYALSMQFSAVSSAQKPPSRCSELQGLPRNPSTRESASACRLSSGHHFSRAISRKKSMRLQPLREPFFESFKVPLRDGEVDIAQDEKRCENPEQHTDLANFSGGDLHHCIGNHAEAQARRNAEREWRREHGDECRESVAEIVPSHTRHRLHHQRSNQNQRGRSSKTGNRGRNRREKHRRQEQSGNENVAQ